MGEYICLFNNDALIIKPPKKSPILRTIVLLFTMVLGVHICSICIKRSHERPNTKFSSIQVIERHRHYFDCDQSQVPYLHYPKPETFNRVECACNPVRYFAILSMQRSGSGWFEKVYNLDWFMSASKNHCSAAVGFKWMLNQGLMEHHKDIAKYFNSSGISIIFLFRRNLLRRMVSVLANSYDRHAKRLNGTHKSHVHSLEEAETLSKYKPTINATSLVNVLKEMELAAVKASEFFRSTRHIVLYYEDLTKNRTKLVEAQEFLGVPVMNLTSRQVKIHVGPLPEHIKNWADINKTLIGTPYENFLYADY